ncbi:MAG: hypothetical protein M1821_005801 [Bathelium mastoideum]|nr:MAG: hypothetical protein M1821_005801 [Bathelium mastoideum]
MVLEAGYPNTKGFRKVTKVTVLIKKKEGMSDEDFMDHYNNIHARMADMLHGKANLLPYDAICTFVFPDYKAFAKFMYDPESNAMNKDHVNFMDESQMKMMVGDEYMLIDNGERIEKD